jgi:DNA-binding FadR family transcriptional regulator
VREPDVATPPAVHAQPAFRRLRGGNAYEETVERLLQAVKLGQVPAGERLPAERELATTLGVSRLTLREAIRSLAEAGYVESRRGRAGGTFVLPSHEWRRDHRDAREIALDMGSAMTDALLMREVLEPGGADLAARAPHRPEAVAELRAALEHEQSAPVIDYRPADSRLHLAIVALAASPSLSAAVSDNRMRLNDLLDAIPLLPPNIEHSRAQHARIVSLVLRGRPEEARAAMAGHLQGTASLLRGFLA